MQRIGALGNQPLGLTLHRPRACVAADTGRRPRRGARCPQRSAAVLRRRRRRHRRLQTSAEGDSGQLDPQKQQQQQKHGRRWSVPHGAGDT